jgi:murein DD-endopeptidase MepM/ murein hydrolase activator NlpD
LALIDLQPDSADAEQQPVQARSRRELHERARAAEAAEHTHSARRLTSARASLGHPVGNHLPPVPAGRTSRSRAVEAGAAARSRARVRDATARHGVQRDVRPNRPAARPGRPRVKRMLVSKLMTLGAMLGVGAMLVATSLPANAFYDANAVLSAAAVGAVEQAGVQSLRIDTTATAPSVSRDAYTVSSLAEKLRIKYGARSYSFVNNPNGSIQWPFAVSVPISSGFGDRVAPCFGCSSYHEGTDFTPGAGAVIQAIADGVVSATSVTGAYGNHVVVDHMIDGQLVQSLYAHMQYGSIRVAVGQTITVGTEIGQVGSTGSSTGAHLHLEIHINGTPVDPFVWLKAHAN